MLGIASLSVVALLLAAGQASALTVSNTANITINDATTDGVSKASTPDPSTLTVSNVVGPVTHVTATLNGFAHGCPTDVDVLLVGPSGQKSILMSDIGDCHQAAQPGPDRPDINLTFDDAAASGVPCLVTDSTPPGGTPVSNTNMSGGTFKPTDGPPKGSPGTCAFAQPTGVADNFAVGAPVGPVGPYPTGLAAFNGVNPNGTWQLYVVDQSSASAGHISGGWTLNLTIPAATVTAPSISGTPQVGQTLTAVSGQITNNGAASWAWFRCDGSGNVCGSSPVGTGATYVPVAADKGSTLKLTETVTNTGGSNSASSDHTAIVADANNVQQPSTAPTISSRSTKSKQKVLTQGGVLATLTSNVDGNLVATGTVSVPNLAKTYKFKSVTAKVVANNRTTVVLKLPSKALKAVRKALAKHKKLSAKIKLTVTSTTGRTTTVSKTIKLVK